LKKLIYTVGKIILFFVGWAVLAGVIDIPAKQPHVWRFWAEMVPFIVMVLMTVIFLLAEKGTVHIPIVKKGMQGSAIGFFIGIVWIGCTLIVLMVTKRLWIVQKNDVTFWGVWCFSAFLNVIMQELLVRGYIYQMLKVKYNLCVAVIITTVLFTLMHGGAIEARFLPTVNVITMCLFTTALYEAEGTLLAPIMAHAAWNIVGALVFGAVSLADDYPALYVTKALEHSVLSGGTYKAEGSIFVLFINVLLMMIFVLRSKQKIPE